MSKKHCNKSCSNCPIWLNRRDSQTIELIQRIYKRDDRPWYLGFSGGKDSSAVLKLVFSAISKLKPNEIKKPIFVVYCDTGVEMPLMRALVNKTFRKLRIECKDKNLPIIPKKVFPPIKDRYFVKVIGRGYPPPTNIFRWCTDRLRVNPIKKFIDSSSEERVVILGTRYNESSQRDRTLKKYQSEEEYFQKSKNKNIKIFCPIINYSTEDVWSSIMKIKELKSVDEENLSKVYKHASGECPTYREEKGSPCGKGRFGCWTCTVVRRDKAMENLIEEGYTDLQPLLEYKYWLMSVRDKGGYRRKYRRNGTPGKGPFTLTARKSILNRLLKVEELINIKLISKLELNEIYRVWDEDRAA